MTEDNSALLGPIVKAWFSRNEWPQSVSEGLARAKGWTCGPWASQVSICMSGRLTPKPNFFRGFGQFNQAVAERDFMGITDRRLMDRLKRGEPLTHPDGMPWASQDFFAAYVGALEAPADLLAPPKPVVTQEMVDEWAARVRQSFRDVTKLSMNPAGVVWAEIKSDLISQGVSPEDVDWLQEVLCGLTEPTVEMATRTMIKYPDHPLINSLERLQNAYGGEITEIKKLRAWRESLPKPEETDRTFKGLPTNAPEIKNPMFKPDRSLAFTGASVITLCCFGAYSACV